MLYTNNTLYLDDNLKILPTLEPNSVDSIVTDPPYGISLLGKGWDKSVPSVVLWQECLRVLKPGGYLIAFGGARTYHRMAVNVEDAGFEIRDQLMWIYSTAMPKSMNIGKEHDRLHGNKRTVVGKGKRGNSDNNALDIRHNNKYFITTGNSDYEGLGTNLKPAHEPIILARKPLCGTVLENIMTHGTGGLNIDDCRVPRAKDDRDNYGLHTTKKRKEQPVSMGTLKTISVYHPNEKGRYPANIIHDGSKEIADIFPGGQQKYFYCARAKTSDRNFGLPEGIKNEHPTVKPIELMKHLVSLVTPTGGTALDPYMGSGTTGVACKSLGFEFIGIEQDKESFEIAQMRLETSIQINLLMKAHE